MTDTHIVYLGLGSNLGDREGYIEQAITLIGERIGAVQRRSALHVTSPWGFQSENQFVNAVVRCQTTLLPHPLLKATQAIERLMGRRSKSKGGVYHDRIIDIDILLYDDWKIDTPDLVIPHPLMWEREFVTVPLKEVMGETEVDQAPVGQ